MALNAVAEGRVGGHEQDATGAKDKNNQVEHGRASRARMALIMAGWRKASMGITGVRYKGRIRIALCPTECGSSPEQRTARYFETRSNWRLRAASKRSRTRTKLNQTSCHAPWRAMLDQDEHMSTL
ncbi:MAG TPA: hypothetical protein VJ779_16640 [Acetobacteraceae bacterium]|nr:hypothetical protein [Acetobacteraceae bacterium]